jgi:elongation factor G
VDDVVGGAIPGQYIPAVEKGVRHVLAEGVIAGFPLQDLRVIVYDGKHHSVDSKEVAFVAAGRRAFQNAFREGGPIVLEPIVRVEVTTPSAATGDVTGDLATRRGRISGNHALAAQRTRISALVPLAELNDYQSRVKSLTGGDGIFTMELSHYDPVPPRKQQELIGGYRKVEEE